MLSCYCSKCRRNTESKNPKFARTKTKEQCFYQIVQYVIVKYRNFANSKKLVDYEVV